MTEVWTNHYCDSNGDPLVVDCCLDLDTAIDFAANSPGYVFTVHVKDEVATKISLHAMIEEYLAEQAAEARHEKQEARRQYA